MKLANYRIFNILFTVVGLLVFSNLAAKTNTFDGDKPTVKLVETYNQSFNPASGWNSSVFYGMWLVVDPKTPFAATDIANGYLQFAWPAKRIMYSISKNLPPYVFETSLDYGNGTNRGGIVIRYPETVDKDKIQEAPTGTVGFNSTGIAFYPADATNFRIQFSGVQNGASTVRTQISVPKPGNITSLLTGANTLRIEDFGTTVYAYLNNNPYVRINLGGLQGNTYTSGTVYDANMVSLGTFSNMVVVDTGRVSVAQRDATIRLYSASLMVKQPENALFDADKPAVNYPGGYTQEFNPTAGWDNTKFYNQWVTKDANCFTESDISKGYLQFKWMTKRVMCSGTKNNPPYVFETKIDYAGGSNHAGVVLRFPDNVVIDKIQEGPNGTTDYNSTGIALYPVDANNMYVQFSGKENGTSTTRTQIIVPRPLGVGNLLNGTLIFRVEDFGSVIYIYLNDAQFVRINLGGLVGTSYTSGMVYDVNMMVKGTFSNMEIAKTGKVAIAERASDIHLYSASIKCKTDQTLTFKIPNKLVTDQPFTLNASTTSGLPITYTLISGPASINGNTLTLNGTMGYVQVSAEQTGNDQYASAQEITSFFVESINNETTQNKASADTWVATDALGRSLPNYDDCGKYKQKKYVGMFYWLWQEALMSNATIKLASDVVKDNPASPAFEFLRYYHDEPEAGFYHPSDKWAIRRNLQMLANAGIDFVFFDFTNGNQGYLSLDNFMSVAMEMYNSGIPVPKISFFMNVNFDDALNSAMDKVYARPEYDPLLFKWDGKPLLMADSSMCKVQSIRDHFTWRKTWAYDNSPWKFIATYPQTYNLINGNAEQMPVTKAGGAPFKLENGSSFKNNTIPEYDQYWETDVSKYGLAFDEQWSQAHEIDPSIVCLTGWNEQVAGAWISTASNPISFMGKNWDDASWRCVNQAICPNKDANGVHIPHGWYFVDEFNTEFNRDMEPLKGKYSDNYYYQMISHIRKYKGMNEQEPASAPKTINIDGTFSEWSNVTPVYADIQGDTGHRNFQNINNTATLVNNTGRNDIIESRVTYDNSNVYFYVKTAQNLSPYTDPNWMLLFINTDRNKATGWEGYDYVVNMSVITDTQTTLKKWNGSNWTNDQQISYKFQANEMEISIPRNLIGLSTGTLGFNFHWADNPQQLTDITSFFTDGDSAPDRRFDYNFNTVNQTSYKENTVPGSLEFEDYDNGGRGIAYSDSTVGNTGGAYRIDEDVDIEPIVGGGYDVSWCNANEWLNYTLNTNMVGKFSLNIKFASDSNDNTASILIDNQDVTGILNFPSTAMNWGSKSIDIPLTGGKHKLKFLMNSASGNLKLDKMDIVAKDAVDLGNGTGLSKSLWAASVGGRTWFKDSICSQIDPFVSAVWGDNSPGCSISNDFWNVRWQGYVLPYYSETYTFYLIADDLARLWVNNQLVSDGWLTTNTGKSITGKLTLTAGQKVPIKVDFAEKTGNAYVKLEWSSASTLRQEIPTTQLFPLAPPNAVHDISLFDVLIYPNPTNHVLYVNSGQNELHSIDICDLQGRVIQHFNKQFAGLSKLELSLSKGIYMIRMYGNSLFKTQKLIIE